VGWIVESISGARLFATQGRLDLIEHIGMAIQHFEQLDQG
jgi:hypothetical protein